nr:uncharacterized protein LOC127324180 [Lolium perenne]
MPWPPTLCFPSLSVPLNIALYLKPNPYPTHAQVTTRRPRRRAPRPAVLDSVRAGAAHTTDEVDAWRPPQHARVAASTSSAFPSRPRLLRPPPVSPRRSSTRLRRGSPRSCRLRRCCMSSPSPPLHLPPRSFILEPSLSSPSNPRNSLDDRRLRAPSHYCPRRRSRHHARRRPGARLHVQLHRRRAASRPSSSSSPNSSEGRRRRFRPRWRRARLRPRRRTGGCICTHASPAEPSLAPPSLHAAPTPSSSSPMIADTIEEGGKDRGEVFDEEGRAEVREGEVWDK